MSMPIGFWEHTTRNSHWIFLWGGTRQHPSKVIPGNSSINSAAREQLAKMDDTGFPVVINKIAMRGPDKGKITTVAVYARKVRWKAVDLAYRKYCKKAGIPFRSLHVPKMRTKEERDQVAKPLQNR